MAAALKPESGDDADAVIDAHIVSLRLMFSAWLAHFLSHGYIKDSTMDKFDQTVLPKAISQTVRDFKAREAIGNSARIWDDLRQVLSIAVPSLEQRSYASLHPEDEPEGPYDGPSSNKIVENSATLLQDLQRLDNVLGLARNVLAAGEKAQNLAAQLSFDKEVCSVIRLCVKITARGFDGDGATVEENKWQEVINGFKKLLITSMQVLNNLITSNERLKLMLWVELFDSTSDSATNDGPEVAGKLGSWERNADNWMSSVTSAFLNQTTKAKEAVSHRPTHASRASRPLKPPTAYFLYLDENREKIKSEMAVDSDPSTREIVQEASRRWEHMSDSEKDVWRQKHNDRMKQDHSSWEGSDETTLVDATAQLELDESESHEPAATDPTVPDSDYRMSESAADGAKKLADGKAELLKRLQTVHPERHSPSQTVCSPIQSPASPENGHQEVDFPDEADVNESDADADADADGEGEGGEESSDEDDEGYALPGEDGRGLLTDVPLILGPNEIEVLPMIVMNGICRREPDESKDDDAAADESNLPINLYTIRCHLLLAQENGRNLLRELLIFVAAWDLREEELYFKFMVKIIEAILMNGLMPFAYSAFKESKDIISPAQAVIMKLLTKIFHTRHAFISQPSQVSPIPKLPYTPSGATSLRFDVQIVHFFFTEFRQNIIPQICALIFLQGQIREGQANVEDFPLNLWDMERMYEGVYQYLEFFAILTDHDNWKQMMADWEVVSELVTLLRELELAIPKARLRPAFASAQPSERHFASSPTAAASSPPPPPPPASAVSVERPYDVDAPIAAPDAYASPSSGAADGDSPRSPSSYPAPLHDEPADFEWRNLKKLCVLVLSSLAWKNRALQDQVRAFGGITVVLSCCGPVDDHNPYIREHAIMCLRFLLEGNTENQDVVRGLAAAEEVHDGHARAGEAEGGGSREDALVARGKRLSVPREVLDSRSYETFMDASGQVGLRRRDGQGVASLTGPLPVATSVDSVLPEWMQMSKNMSK